MPDPKQILATPMRAGNEANAETIGDYLIKLVEQLWIEGDLFSSKKPFGSSDWVSDLEVALVGAGHIEGVFDEDGYLEGVDSRGTRRLILSAIGELREALPRTQGLEGA